MSKKANSLPDRSKKEECWLSKTNTNYLNLHNYHNVIIISNDSYTALFSVFGWMKYNFIVVNKKLIIKKKNKNNNKKNNNSTPK